jgi:hypothetical protein
MEYVIVTSMVVGLVEFIKALFDRDYRTAVIIAGAASVGALCGAFSIEGLTIATGIVIGIGASGVVAVAKKI